MPANDARVSVLSSLEPRREALMMPSGMAMSERDQQRQAAELQRRPEPQHDLGQHRAAGADRIAPVADQHRLEPEEVLHRHGLIEAIGGWRSAPALP